MQEITITPFYTALTVLIMVVLAVRAASSRIKYRVAVGDDNNDKMTVILRGFGNLTEYAPAVLLLLFFMELKGIDARYLHAFGGLFIACRILHPIALYGRGHVPMWKIVCRPISVVGTFLLMIVGAAVLLIP